MDKKEIEKVLAIDYDLMPTKASLRLWIRRNKIDTEFSLVYEIADEYFNKQHKHKIEKP